ncbi:MAG: site-specific integrase [Proteobacteria bacterium]|nr:site-specific integrase [Pseudomonadota bacterium]
MGRKRGNGEGSISRRKDGLWTARYTPLGGGKRRAVYARTQREVLEKLDDLKASDASGTLALSGRETFGEWMEHWLDNVHRRKVRESTLAEDSGCIKKHVIPRLGRYPLAKLQPEHIEMFIAEMEGDSVGSRTIVRAFGFVRQALKHAVKARKIAWNPLEAVEAPRDRRREALAFGLDDVRKLLAAADGHPYEALIGLAVHTGMRWGELAGLSWGDIDLETGVVTVRRSQVEFYDPSFPIGQRTRLKLNIPKTAGSRRAIRIGPDCIATLRRHRASLSAIPHKTRRVFLSPDELPLRLGNFMRRQWKPLLKRAQLPESFRFKNATRHTMATTALTQGISARVVQERLGHSDIATTLGIYSHVMPEVHEQAADQLEAAMNYANRTPTRATEGE